MSSKLIVLSAFLAIAKAGNIFAPAAVAYETPAAVAAIPHLPYAYAAAASPLAVQLHTPAVGSSHQSTLRSLDGNSAISHYSKSVDTAFSSVRKVDTRITNDAKILAPATFTYASAPIVKTAPVLSYQPSEHLTYAAYAAPAPATHVVSHTSFTGLGAAYAF